MDANLPQSNIKTIRLIYLLPDAAEKEVIKEFFRFVGCLVYDMPVRSQNDFDNLVVENPWHDVDIILNLHDYSTKWEPTDITKRVFITYHLEAQGKAGKYVDGEKRIVTSKKDLNKNIIEYLIKQIWPKETRRPQQISLLKINTLYHGSSLTEYLQMKRALNIINMPEVLGKRSGMNKISIKGRDVSKYIGKMMNQIWQVYRGLKLTELKTESVYSIYAQVNAARKIREIFKLLDEIPDGLQNDVTAVDPNELLIELGRLYDMDSQYYSVFFLSAYICQSDFSLNLRAGRYYEAVLKKVAEVGNVSNFEAFVVYKLGSYNEKVLHDYEKSFAYFTKATDIDPECYQARFKLGCYKTRQNRYIEAIQDFQKVINVLMPQTDPEWECIPLKRIQYIYKSYIWMADIAEHYLGSLENASLYLSRAAVAAEAYTRNSCVYKMLDMEDEEELEKYHFQSMLAGYLWSLLMRRAEIYGNSGLKSDIKSRVRRLEGML